MLELGRSQSWTRALHTISGDVRMNAAPLMDYFKKLHDWLIKENQNQNRTVGWKTEVEPCKYETPLGMFWIQKLSYVTYTILDILEVMCLKLLFPLKFYLYIIILLNSKSIINLVQNLVENKMRTDAMKIKNDISL